MNNRFSLRHYFTLLAGATSLIVTQEATAAPTPSKTPAAPAAAVSTNVVAKSIFTIPANPKQGRDPFFPESQRFVATVPTTNAEPVSIVSPSALVLQGISGGAERRLAIINGRTLAEGEETEVSVNGTRIRFRCLEIKADVVVVEIGTERRELRLRSGF